MKIGVLGGIGPQATGEFYCLLIRRMQEQNLIRSNADYPQIIINSIPAQELVSEVITSEDLKEYTVGLKELDSLAPDIIVMVCNTIHLYYDQLQSSIKTPIFFLPNAIRNKANLLGVHTLSVLGTPQTVRSGLYQFDEFDYINPTDAQLHRLGCLVHQFNAGIKKKQAKKECEYIARSLFERGAQGIILGCTEFAVMLSDLNVPLIDSISVLVDSIIERIGGTMN